MAETIKIGGELESTATGNVVAAASAIKDKVKNKYQGEINAETDASLADRYTKAETYNKTELNNMITTPNQQYVSVTANSQTTAVTDVLPATGEANTIYRVGNWDGSQFDASVYSEYAWNGSSYVHLNTKTQVGEVFDISVYHATGSTLATYADLSAALDSNNGGGVPQSLQKGGMSIKFVQSSDNKYVQYRLMSNTFNTTVANWQGVDNEPVAESNNLVKSGGVYDYNAKLLGGSYSLTKSVSSGGNANIAIFQTFKQGDKILLKWDGDTSFSNYAELLFNGTQIERNSVKGKVYEYICPNDGSYVSIYGNGAAASGSITLYLERGINITLKELDKKISHAPYDTMPVVDSRNSGLLLNLLANKSYFTVSDDVFAETANENWRSSDYLPIDLRLFEAELYIDYNKPHVVFFNANKEYIGKNEFDTGKKIAVSKADMIIPAGAVYFRIQSLASQSSSYIYTCVLNKNYIYNTDYLYEQINDEPLSDLCINGTYLLDNNGVLTETASPGTWESSDYIEISRIVDFDTTVYVDAANKPKLMFFDSNKNYIGRGDAAISGELEITEQMLLLSPSNAKYFRIQNLKLTHSSYTYSLKQFKSVGSNDNPFILNLSGRSSNIASLINSILTQYKNIEIVSDDEIPLDGTIVMDEGMSIKMSPCLTIKQTVNAMMVCNKAISLNNNQSYDNESNIVIEGGIWDANSKYSTLSGCRGAMSFVGVHNLRLQNLSIINASSFALQVNTATNMKLLNLRFEGGGSDAIHLGGDINGFVIDGIYGNTTDDFIALNAWDWSVSTPHYGTIQNGRITNIHCNYAWHISRLLGATDGTNIYTVKNISFDGVYGNAKVSIIDAGYQPDPNHPEDTFTKTEISNISFENVYAKLVLDSNNNVNVVNIYEDVDNLSFKNCCISADDNTRFGIVLKEGCTISKLTLINNSFTSMRSIFYAAENSANNFNINSVCNTFAPVFAVADNRGTGTVEVTSLMDNIISGNKTYGSVVWVDK